MDAIDDAFAAITNAISQRTKVTGEYREQQIRFAKAINITLNEGKSFLGQAGTGVGKTFAYLVPIILSGKSAIITTATKYLSDQLIAKDLAFLSNIFPDLSYYGLKGVQNYACVRGAMRIVDEYNKMQSSAGEDQVQGDGYARLLNDFGGGRAKLTMKQAAAFYILAHGTKELADIPYELSSEDRSELSTNTSSCKNECPMAKDGKCAMTEAFYQASRAKILVTNHAQITQWLSIALEGDDDDATSVPDVDFGGEDGDATGAQLRLLGYGNSETRQIWVADEAHELEANVASALSHVISRSEFEAFKRDMAALLTNYHKTAKSDDKRDEKNKGSGEHVNVDDIYQGYKDSLDKISKQLNNYSDILDSYLEMPVMSKPGNNYQNSTELVFKTLPEKIEQINTQVIGYLSLYSENIKNAALKNEHTPKIKSRIMSLINLLSQLHIINPEKQIIYLSSYSEHRRRGGEHMALHIAPLDISSSLSNLKQSMQLVAVSATLQVDQKLESSINNLGYKLFREGYNALNVGDVFDFKSQGGLFVPPVGSFPDPSNSRDAHLQAYLEASYKIIEASNGGALCLLTTRREATECAKFLQNKVKDKNIYSFDDNTDLEELVSKFRSDENSILVGTRSFFQGLDLPGATLRAVLINKIPFPVPDILLQAKQDFISQSGGSSYQAFMRCSVTPAAHLLTQACGRLIRHGDDRGIVAVFDHRLLSKSYGRVMLNSLPPFKRIQTLDDAVEFAKTLRQ